MEYNFEWWLNRLRIEQGRWVFSEDGKTLYHEGEIYQEVTIDIIDEEVKFKNKKTGEIFDIDLMQAALEKKDN